MEATARRPWTAEELCRLPGGWRYEIDEGELVIMTPAGWKHNRAVTRIARLLGNFVEERKVGGEVITNELGILLRREPVHTLRAPDVAYFSAEQVARIGDERGFPTIAPTLAVEVQDASEPDISRKVGQYLEAGVRWTHLSRHEIGLV